MEPSAMVKARETVLVVDDTPANRDLVQMWLRDEYRVLEASNGFEALDVIGRERVDLVLLDVMMPGVDGFDVCREIKTQGDGAFLPVILLTALGRQEDRNRGLDVGADDFLTKPVDPTELRLRVLAFLRIRRQDALIREQVESLRRLQAMKDDFMGLVLHDLRSPLTALNGYLGLLARRLAGHEDPKVMKRIDGALVVCERLAEIADGVLEVQALEAAALPVCRTATSLGEVIEKAVSTLQGAADANGVELRPTTAADAVAWVDGRLVARAIENLVANALKYSREGSQVDVSASRRKDHVIIEVADRGPGIPDELKQKIFERFRSVEAADERRGHGLGLHLVQLVAEAHGGDVSAHDNEGGGSVFRLELPADAPISALSRLDRGRAAQTA